MANTRIQIKSSGSAGVQPTGPSLANGELALNYADEKLYFKNSGGTVKSFSTTGGTASPGGLTTEVQFNDSGSLGGNASFTFDKTTSTVTVGLPSSNANTIIQPSLMASGRFIKSPYPIAAPTPIINKGNGSLSNNGVLITPHGGASLTIDVTGRFVYLAATNGLTGNIGQYSINQVDGTLSTIGLINTGTSDGLGYITSDPTGRFVYITNIADGNISQYRIEQSNGALTSIGVQTGVGDTSVGIAVDPTGRFAYQALQEQSVSDSYINYFSINQTTGALTALGSTSTGSPSNPSFIFIDPTGRFLYVIDDVYGNIQQYSINQTSGSLTNLGTISLGGAPSGIQGDCTGRFVYVTFSDLNYIKSYSINQSNGYLTLIATTTTNGVGPNQLAIDPTAKFLYVSQTTSSNIGYYEINQTSGNLRFLGSISSGPSPRAISVDPTGRFVYSFDITNAAINQYIVNNFSAGSAIIAGALSVNTITANTISPNTITFTDGTQQTTAAEILGRIHALSAGYTLI